MFLKELWQQACGTLDGTCDKLGEEGDINGENARMIFRRALAMVDVDGVTERLECVKRNPNRKKYFQFRDGIEHVELIESQTQGIIEKVEILEGEQ